MGNFLVVFSLAIFCCFFLACDARHVSQFPSSSQPLRTSFAGPDEAVRVMEAAKVASAAATTGDATSSLSSSTTMSSTANLLPHQHLRQPQQHPPLTTSTSLSSSNSLVLSPADFASLVEGTKPYARGSDAAVFVLTRGPSEAACASMREFDRHFVSTNPADVFVFSVAGGGGGLARDVAASCLDSMPGFYAIDMLRHAGALGWGTPEHLRDRALWGGRWTEGYRQMGHWRLTKQFRIARALGYSYALQIDDDSEFPAPGVSENLFETMRRDGLKIAGRASFPEGHGVAVGLPELARYFIVTEKVANGFEPSPLLWTHCKPPSIEGLYSDLTGKENAPGWDRWMFYGNFVIFDVEFMHDPMLARFVSLVEQSGGHFRFRWNEQATTAMIWHLFVKDGEWRVFDFPYRHGVVQ